MALGQSALLEVLEALKVADVGDRVRTAAETIYQALIEAELAEAIGAGPHERSAERTNQRNGHRSRTLTTTAGDLELRIPKLRTGSFFPSLLERRAKPHQPEIDAQHNQQRRQQTPPHCLHQRESRKSNRIQMKDKMRDQGRSCLTNGPHAVHGDGSQIADKSRFMHSAARISARAQRTDSCRSPLVRYARDPANY
jgi:hypothetical protein